MRAYLPVGLDLLCLRSGDVDSPVAVDGCGYDTGREGEICGMEKMSMRKFLFLAMREGGKIRSVRSRFCLRCAYCDQVAGRKGFVEGKR